MTSGAGAGGGGGRAAWWPGGVRAAAQGAADLDPALLGGDAWRSFSEALGRAGELVLRPGYAGDELDRAEGYRHLLVLMRMGISEALGRPDPDRPSFHWSDGEGKWGLDCADGLYAQAAVRGGASYRIRGHRGTVHFLGFQLMTGLRPSADVDADTLKLEADGSFEILLAPDASGPNAIALPPDAGALITRQFFYDWDTEEPARLWIDRIDAAPSAEPDAAVRSGALARQLEALAAFVDANTEYWAEIARQKRDEHLNTFPEDHGIGAISQASQAYQSFGIGAFRLSDDEALLIEVEPPRAKYWSLHLGNFWGESLDYANHQSSLNGHQAQLDADGVFRAVVSRADPAVPNWLDPAGHGQGTMIYRWNQADGSPIPATRVVRLADLRRELPPDTPEIDAAARRAAIERRRQHVRRRFTRPL